MDGNSNSSLAVSIGVAVDVSQPYLSSICRSRSVSSFEPWVIVFRFASASCRNSPSRNQLRKGFFRLHLSAAFAITYREGSQYSAVYGMGYGKIQVIGIGINIRFGLGSTKAVFLDTQTSIPNLRKVHSSFFTLDKAGVFSRRCCLIVGQFGQTVSRYAWHALAGGVVLLDSNSIGSRLLKSNCDALTAWFNLSHRGQRTRRVAAQRADLRPYLAIQLSRYKCTCIIEYSKLYWLSGDLAIQRSGYPATGILGYASYAAIQRPGYLAIWLSSDLASWRSDYILIITY